MSPFVRSMFFVCRLMRINGAFRYFWPIRPAVKCRPAAIGKQSSVSPSVHSNGSPVGLDFSWTIAISRVVTKPAYLCFILCTVSFLTIRDERWLL